MKFVSMVHPEIPGQVATASEKAFEEIHAAKGWELVTPEDALATQVADKPLDKLTKDELVEVMAARGLTVPPGAKNADMVTAIRDSYSQEG